jgi:hypothetical protein
MRNRAGWSLRKCAAVAVLRCLPIRWQFRLLRWYELRTGTVVEYAVRLD